MELAPYILPGERMFNDHEVNYAELRQYESPTENEPEAPKTKKPISSINPQITEVATKIGEFIDYWGFKKIHGRIWTLMFLAEEPVDANYLIKNLGVSKALISMSLKELIQYKVVFPIKEKRSTQHYIANPDVIDAVTEVLINREAKMLLDIRTACELLSRVDRGQLGHNATDARVKGLLGLVKKADNLLKAFIKFKSINLTDIRKALTFKKA